MKPARERRWATTAWVTRHDDRRGYVCLRDDDVIDTGSHLELPAHPDYPTAMVKREQRGVQVFHWHPASGVCGFTISRRHARQLADRLFQMLDDTKEA